MIYNNDGFASCAPAAATKASKCGTPLASVTIKGGHDIATTFWGKAWCQHIESYCDHPNRLPRGLDYVRNGSVIDLQISGSKITAKVSGSEIYTETITIAPLPSTRWEAIKKKCADRIDSPTDLLKGKLTADIMRVITDRNHGLFPASNEIKKKCSCPDSARLCKHLAAVLYAVGSRFDTQPELLFALRGVDHRELIAAAATESMQFAPTSALGTETTIAENQLADVFGIDMAPPVKPVAKRSKYLRRLTFSRSLVFAKKIFSKISDSLAKIRSAIQKPRLVELRNMDAFDLPHHPANSAEHPVGRVTFHLAENKHNKQHPFAFLATYTHGTTDQAKPQYLPFERALKEYAGTRQHDAILSIIAPIQRAAERSPLVNELVETQRIFHLQAWDAATAYRFLRDIPAFEESGVFVRIPDWWRGDQTAHLNITVTLGSRQPAGLGLRAILDFNPSLTLDGEPLTDEELARITASVCGLVMIKGRWIEIDRDKLHHTLDYWKKLNCSDTGGLTFAECFRLLAGAPDSAETIPPDIREWTHFNAGDWLATTLATLRDPALAVARATPPPGLRATLRPYQITGSAWLRFLTQLGLGACLADDMGLGKTMQILALLQQIKNAERESSDSGTQIVTKRDPALVVCPASLIGNWLAEAARFAPELRVLAIHPSETSAEKIAEYAASRITEKETQNADSSSQSLSAQQHPIQNQIPSEVSSLTNAPDLVLISYGMLLRQDWLIRSSWSLVVLDEAQAIKNPDTQRTHAAKKLRAPARIALTGTPIENNLTDLWSIFDFLNPGLLDTTANFNRYLADPGAHALLRQIVRPYILRRLKTDRAIIADLPDKIEKMSHCALTKKQVVFYNEVINNLADGLKKAKSKTRNMDSITQNANATDMRRRGLILTTLLRLKQICDHPVLLPDAGEYTPADSGKFQRLAEICSEIASRHEKVIVFTQFRKLTDPLQKHLDTIFGRPGLVLHGAVPVKDRHALIEQFQRHDGPPYFVLTTKAGGTGLTLTQATHVIHFDRWWNPAVENQATDRAFRIGQSKNVFVYKLICRGTIEEKIDSLITNKKTLSEEMLAPGAAGEKLLTEMPDEELLKFVSLNLPAAHDK